MPALDDPGGGRDLRLPLLATVAWAAALASRLPGRFLAALLVAAVLGVAVAHRRGRDVLLAGACLLVAAAVVGGALVRVDTVRSGPVARLAAASAVVHVSLTVVSDPVRRTGRFSDYVLLRGRIDRVSERGRSWRTRATVLVVADPAWSRYSLGTRLEVLGRLARADSGDDLSGLLTVDGTPRVRAGPDVWWRVSGAVRAAVRDSVAGRPAAPRALVPALVDGDGGSLPDAVTQDFRTTGLTHLLAVSGTNLTLVVGFLLTVARWCGVRGRALLVVGGFGIAAFVLLARTEPSVLRAAAMGAVGLIGLRSNGRGQGIRALAAAVIVLLLVDPWLADSVGFVLSALATAGILFLAPGWRDALARWLPRSVAEAIAVPAAAQLACTPVVAAISGQVSLVAVAANLVAAPVVGPATILGLTGGLTQLVVPPIGGALSWGASLCAAWLVEVAERGAALPTAAIGWGTGPVALALLTAGCVGLVAVAPRLLRRPATGVGASALLVVAVLVPIPTPGWPPTGWVLVACDVGQGDGLVLQAAPGVGVVVDAGPDPRLMDRCLDRLGIHRVPLLVLTHFHADHVDGLSGVYDGRRVEELDVTADAQPPSNVTAVLAQARGRSTVRVPAYGETRTIGDLSLEVIGPVPGSLRRDEGEDEGSGPNDASLVLLVQVRGIRLLLAGDVEPDAQADLARAWPGLHVDVLKVPHHGSRYQDLPWLLGLGARAAVVSVGVDNDYGHPSPETLGPLTAAGIAVRRTDQDGDVAVVVDAAGRVRLVERH